MLRIPYITITTLLLLILTACGNQNNKNNTPLPEEGETQAETTIKVSKAQFEGEKMALGKLVEKDFPLVVEVRGSIDVPPKSNAIISSFMGGYVKKTHLLVGDRVRKGEPLLSLENPTFIQLQQEYMESVEQLVYLKSEFERQRSLVEEKITSQKNFLRAESEYKRNLAMYNGLRKKLQMLNISPDNVEKGNIVSQVTIYAPIDGNITKVNISPGMYVSPSDEIMEIVNTEHIHLELTVFEKDIMQIKKGQDILFKIPEASDKIYHAEVYLVGTSIDSESRTVQVHGHLHNDDNHSFAVGMFVEAGIVTENKKLKALPEESIISVDNDRYVVVLVSEDNEGYSLEAKKVSIGDSYGGFTAITDLENLKENDKVIVKGGFNLIGESEGHDH
ncbi:efflux RND transporter periplasmic adaptor subunit [Arenibacter latericius]|uniref:efflux RND transporter periplasmic adaptor subunit n=1 Tax=Arenibacter latericius TaxID=86104 RepID=UPI00042A3E48|nr:efflux RND transporter periplasmic adaptor subunit [Arenibacter latericius]MDX1363232.1 efflux RND transporter periplasmic adaptor subunit [Arenibacter latericius]